ncbi:unnamed protein product [Rotaria sordida]|uniref:Transposase n=1 Tax=Rotaria sordida TaxID=392033 RepID=A0A813Y946_9BILA|nr:unnamed protein product [Rotaria sordida]CAF0930157.1 unnamed protein product [Rotaria sordida]CAF3868186.1 unnamed protein product [Rotaria sordida]CAF3906140.1 unnamed protein product [Rotaria sordida]
MDNEYNRYYIKIRTIFGINPKTIHEELAIALGPNAPSYPTVTEWAKRFREGREDVNDDPRSGRPVSELTDENIELVREVITNDPHSTYDDIIAETFLSHGTIERIIHDCLQMKKITSQWVPHQLTDEQKQERVKLCRENLAKFRDGSYRLCDIKTGNETWIYHRQIHRKSTNASWVGEDESPTTIVRRGKFEPKNLFSVFFKSNSPVLIDAVDEGKTMDHNYYIENCLKPVVKEIWKQRKSAGTKEQHINIMSHPPYSPDLAPCDYWLNDYIKRNLTDQPDEKSLARVVSKVMKKIPKEEFKKTFDKLLERMELCINNHGDYFEHLIK